jgi:23S rRNA pseudouridine1911/1915/1917 synthase
MTHDESQLFSQEAPLISEERFAACVLHCDDDLIVLDKPGWLVCHPSKNGPWSSLVGAARVYFEAETLHLVSRLDRETSGLVLLARHRAAARFRQMAFQERTVRKTYMAILEGTPTRPDGRPIEVSRALEPDPDSAVHVKQRIVRGYGGQKAQTTFRLRAAGGGYSLFEVTPHTGRKHQIRVHAASLGSPVVGDKLYGNDEKFYLHFIEHGFDPWLRERLPLPRHALHAHRLDFESRSSTETFRAPLPADMRTFCEQTMGLKPEDLAPWV